MVKIDDFSRLSRDFMASVYYDKFLNCKAFLYNLPPKENSRQISYDRKFNNFKKFNKGGINLNSYLFYPITRNGQSFVFTTAEPPF